MVDYGSYFLDSRPMVNRMLGDYMQTQKNISDYRLAERGMEQQAQQQQFENQLALRKQDVSEGNLGLRAEEFGLAKRTADVELSGKALDVVKNQLGFIAKGLDSVKDGNSYQSFRNIVLQMTQAGLLPKEYAQIPEKYDKEKIDQARDTLKAALGEAPEWGPSVVGPGGSRIQRNLRTGKEEQVVGREGSQPSANRYTNIKTSEGVYRFDKTTGDIEPLTDVQGDPILPVTADPALEGRKTTAKKQSELMVARKAELPKVQAHMDSFGETIDRLVGSDDPKSEYAVGQIDRAAEMVNWRTTGLIGEAAAKYWRGEAHTLSRRLETIMANKVLTTMTELKKASKTGATGFGQLSEKELAILQADLANLAQSQQPDELRYNLNTFKKHLIRTKERLGTAFRNEYGSVMEDTAAVPENEPPMEGAKKAPDGNWYVRQPDGKWAIVRE